MIYGMKHVENTTQIGLRKPTSCLWTGLHMDSLQITINQEPLWHQVVKCDIHDRKWRFSLLQVKLAAAHFVPRTRLININQLCYLLFWARVDTGNMANGKRGKKAGEIWRGGQRRHVTRVKATIQISSSRQRMSNSASVAPLLINRWRWRFSSTALSVETRQHH